jgi:uncharacterized membrane protein YccC
VSGTAAALLVTASCLLGLATFTLLHRRDAFGAVAALLVGFSGVAAGLVGFAAAAPNPAAAAQLQAYAVVSEVLGVLCAGVGSALAAVLWRRSRSDLLTEPVASPGANRALAVEATPGRGDDQGDDPAGPETEPVAEESEAGLDGGAG